MFRNETQGDSKASVSQNQNKSKTSSAFIKLDELQEKIKRNELTVLDLSEVRVDDLKAEVKAIKDWKGHESAIGALTMLPGGELASGSGDNTIKLWNVKTGECVRTLSGHSSYVRALTVLPGGELASASHDKTIKLWNVKTGECVRTLSGHSGYVPALTVLPGGELASGSYDNTIKLWNVKTGECVRTLSGHKFNVNALTVLPGGELASGSDDRTIKLWNVKTGECVRTLSGNSDGVSALTVLPGGELVASGCTQEIVIKLRNVKTGERVRMLRGHDYQVSALTMLPGGELASASHDKTIKLWNVKTGECVRTLSGHKNYISALTVLPGGELASGSHDQTIKLWNTAALQRRLSWNEVNGLITLLKSHRSLTRLTMGLSLDEMKAPEDKVIESLVGLVLANTSLVQLDIQKTGMSEQGVRKLYEAVKERKPALVIEHEAISKIQGKPTVTHQDIVITERQKPTSPISILDPLMTPITDAKSPQTHSTVFTLPSLESQHKMVADNFQDQLKLAQDGDAKAQNYIGNCYRNGKGVAKNEREAFEWYKKAALQGYVIGQNNVGCCYEHGLGIEENWPEAFMWYQRSAEQGYANAQYNLSLCYERGLGVKQNDAHALIWRQKSAAQGHMDSLESLKVLEKQNFPLVDTDPSSLDTHPAAKAEQKVSSKHDQGDASLQTTSPASIEINKATLRELLQEFKTSGLSLTDLTQLQQTLATFPVDEVSASVQWIKQCQMQWTTIEARLTTVSEWVETSAEAKAIQAEIDQDLTLQAYQRRLRQELAKFMTAYWLSTSSVFKLSDNKCILLRIVNTQYY